MTSATIGCCRSTVGEGDEECVGRGEPCYFLIGSLGQGCYTLQLGAVGGGGEQRVELRGGDDRAGRPAPHLTTDCGALLYGLTTHVRTHRWYMASRRQCTGSMSDFRQSPVAFTRSTWFLLTLLLALAQHSSDASLPSLGISLGDDDKPASLDGRICAYGDFDKNSYTDVIVQRGEKLAILLQSEQGTFGDSESGVQFDNITLPDRPNSDSRPVYCNVGDFDGDSLLDVMVFWPVTNAEKTHFNSVVYRGNGTGFVPHPVMALGHSDAAARQEFVDLPAVLDINGDGISDVIGFTRNNSAAAAGEEEKFQLFCAIGGRDAAMLSQSCVEKIHYDWGTFTPAIPFSPILADINSDYSPELIFGGKDKASGGKLKLVVFRINDTDYNWVQEEQLSRGPSDDSNFGDHGQVVVGDFNADSIIDLLIPMCADNTCKRLSGFLVYSHPNKTTISLTMPPGAEIVVDPYTKTIFRVGDFTLDGYLDLIVTMREPGQNGGNPIPIVLKNVENGDVTFFRRKFDFHNYFVLSKEMANAEIDLSAFFDLKEDGSIDILVDYSIEDEKTKERKRKISFIADNNKGDTTFLKVQIFTSVCSTDCIQPDPEKHRKVEKGSGVAWTGSCAGFKMDDGWGKNRVSEQCQLPQNSHQALHLPFVLFGLDRSPNFVDMLTISIPVWNPTPESTTKYQHQQCTSTGIVPNSRIIVLPPKQDFSDTTWDIRLYLTPGRLIMQSVLVLVCVCVILLVVIVVLHFRERQQDFKERQAQTHRFHFDAM